MSIFILLQIHAFSETVLSIICIKKMFVKGKK